MSAAQQANTPDVTVRNEAAKAAPAKSPLVKLLAFGLVVQALVLGAAVAYFAMKPAETAEKGKKAKAAAAAKEAADEEAPAEAHGEAPAEDAPPAAGGGAGGAEGKEGAAQPRPMVKIDNVTVRLRNLEVDRYARATFEFETTATANVAKIQNNQPKLRDAILTLLADRAYEDLAGSAGLSKLKADIMAKAVQIFGERQVSGVYVSEFILQ